MKKKYNVALRLWTGNWFYDGSFEYGNEVVVRTNNLDYIYKIQKENFSEIDIYVGKVHWYDLETEQPFNFDELYFQK